MKHTCKGICILMMVLLLAAWSASAGEKKEIHKSFKAKAEVKIETISGDVAVQTGSSQNIRVDLVYDYEPSTAFEPVFDEEADVLILEEHFSGHESVSGSAKWLVTVPAKINIRFSTASGNFGVTGLNGSLAVKTASGDIVVKDSGGQFELHTASGDIEITKFLGTLDAKTASGDIEASDLQGEITLSTASGKIEARRVEGELKFHNASGDIEASAIFLKKKGEFSSASGDVEVILARTPEYDLSVSSASGDAILNYNGQPLKGYFEFQVKKHGGDIEAPFSFDKEEEFEKWGEVYLKKSFSKNGNSPKISIKTTSGQAELLEK